LFEFFFVLLVNYLLTRIYLEIGHLIENFVNDKYVKHKCAGIIKTWEIV